MDRNSAIGLTLIAALLLVYFYFFAPQPQPPKEPQAPAPTETPAPAEEKQSEATIPTDSSLAAYGDLSAFATGQEETTTVENEDVKVVFSNRGGTIESLELKHFTRYRDYKNARDYGKSVSPLKLISPERTTFNLLSTYKGKEIDLYRLFYKSAVSKRGDSTVITFSLPVSDGVYFTQTYVVPPSGYQILYSLSQRGLSDDLSGDNLTFQWEDHIQPLEKSLADTRIYSTVNYSTKSDGFDKLTERSSDKESEQLNGPIKWIAIKQKFFLASIIAADHFAGGQVSTSVPLDTGVVKNANVKLFIPRADLSGGSADFKFYVGPNDYQVIGKVADDFVRNVYLGWPPVSWINRFVIFPVFHFLTGIISSYGLIIIILVILLKLVLFPLSYRSYLSMAKMKVLKPELDEIKEKHGDDMTKVQQEQLKLYQTVGVNPISGCIPVLLQMPILFAMFYLFPASIELRQQPFLWSEDLSTYDSLISLPFTIPFGVGDHISLFTLLMTISTLIYTWQNNQVTSVQGPMKSMQYVMPVIFFFFLNSYSAGLTFYYFVSNLVTFSQQAFIRRFVDDEKIKSILEENRKKNAAGAGKKSRFMTKLQDAMKASEEAKRKADEEKKKRRR